MRIVNPTALAAVLLFFGLISGLTGCVGLTSPSSITFNYEVDGVQKSTSFVPKGIKCDSDGLGVSGFSFPEKPYNSVRISDGTPGSFTAWVREEKVIVFSSDEASLQSTLFDDGSIEYVGNAVPGEVGMADVPKDAQPGDPDFTNAEYYPATADFVVRCSPAEDE